MRSLYVILVAMIAAFMLIGLYYVRMEMEQPGHLNRIERAEKTLSEPARRPSEPIKVIVAPAEPAVVAAPVVAPPPPEAPKVDMTYRLINRIYEEPKQEQSSNLDFFNRPVVTTIPGTLHLKFRGMSTNTEYPMIEAKVSMANLFVLGEVYTREQINAAKK